MAKGQFMANQEHLDLLKQGVDVWNKWREEYPNIQPLLNGANLNGIDLSEVNLSGTQITNSFFGGTKFINANLSRLVMHGSTLNNADLSGANLSEANFSGVNFTEANLFRANFTRTYLVKSIFRGANLCEANLNEALLSGAEFYFANLGKATLIKANLSSAILTHAWLNTADLSDADLGGSFLVNASLREANLSNAYLKGANFSDADLSDANLSHANLSRAILVGTNLTRANLTNCFVYGISCWDVVLEETKQLNLVITPPRQLSIAVDNLKVAQFIYLLLNNQEIRDVIDTIAKKAVLILGRFTPERKSILEAIRVVLRAQGYLPILFDFPKPDSQDLAGTVSTLANISRFIIADLTDPSCSPYEIGLVATYMKPIKPLFQPSKASKHEFAMFQDLRNRYSWVLPVYRYKDQESLLASMQDKVIAPAEKKIQMLEKKKRR